MRTLRNHPGWNVTAELSIPLPTAAHDIDVCLRLVDPLRWTTWRGPR